jgi:hypothetical protein
VTTPKVAFLGEPRPLPEAPAEFSILSYFRNDQRPGDDIGFSMLTQEAVNWCWSAVTQAVLYHAHGGQPRSQSSIANDHIRRSQPGVSCIPDQGATSGGECESASCSRPCNGLHKVRVVLSEVGFTVRTLQAGQAVTFDQIRTEVRDRRPVVCRIEFRNGGGHFICVSGWRVVNGVREVLVHDPRNGQKGGEVEARYIPYSNLTDHYVAGGSVGYNNYAYGV